MVAGLGLGVFGAALATLIAQGISAVFSLFLFLSRMRRYKSRFDWFDIQEYMSRQHNVKVSERMAERIKIHVRRMSAYAAYHPLSEGH